MFRMTTMIMIISAKLTLIFKSPLLQKKNDGYVQNINYNNDYISKVNIG